MKKLFLILTLVSLGNSFAMDKRRSNTNFKDTHNTKRVINKGTFNFALVDEASGYDSLEKIYIWQDNIKSPINFDNNPNNLPAFLHTSQLQQLKNGGKISIQIELENEVHRYTLQERQQGYNICNIATEDNIYTYKEALKHNQAKQRNPIPAEILEKIGNNGILTYATIENPPLKTKHSSSLSNETLKRLHVSQNQKINKSLFRFVNLYTTVGFLALSGLATWYYNPYAIVDTAKEFTYSWLDSFRNFSWWKK
ncbi:MAG: hypothetical protein AB7R69_06665 [Candidatus Babeliales bacterium]